MHGKRPSAYADGLDVDIVHGTTRATDAESLGEGVAPVVDMLEILVGQALLASSGPLARPENTFKMLGTCPRLGHVAVFLGQALHVYDLVSCS